MQPNIGLGEEQRAGVTRILNALLADEYVLYTKTRNYHWNVVGPQFNDLHKFFEAQYGELDDVVDAVAERVRTLGGRAIGTLAELADLARLAEQPGESPAASRMIAVLLDDHESVARTLRADVETCLERYHDTGTTDFLAGLLEQHEKMAWMLRAFLSEEGQRGRAD